jgi:uncharacterized repeat protein (TIGR03803 family)
MAPTSGFLRQFCLTTLSTCCFFLCSASASTEIVLHNFLWQPDGSEPIAAMVFDKSGNLFGTTFEGGSGDAGTIFEISPNGASGWTYRIIYSFDCHPGCYPQGPLTIDQQGNLYGATQIGGANNDGTIFQLSRQSDGNWSVRTLFVFGDVSNGGGFWPNGVVYHQGALFGLTFSGGEFECGTAFALTPNGTDDWSETVLHSFSCNNGDGWGPVGGVALDEKGNVYGVTEGGGTGFDGTVFELSRDIGGHWEESILHNFSGPDGSSPWYGAAPILDEAGNLYDTTGYGGSGGYGTVFKLSRSGNTWTQTILHNFSGDLDGALLYAGVTMDSRGQLYGTTLEGGGQGVCTELPPPQNLYCGTLFRLTPSHSGEWTETVLHRFGGLNDGAEPAAAVVLDPSDNIYGVASSGGTLPLRSGVVFRFGRTNRTLTTAD